MPTRGGVNPVGVVVVVLLLLVGAAIFVPGLLAARRAENERTGHRMLSMIRQAQEDFRKNDRDANGVNDFWTADVYALYGLIPQGGEPIRLIEHDVAMALYRSAAPAAKGAVSRIKYQVSRRHRTTVARRRTSTVDDMMRDTCYVQPAGQRPARTSRPARR